MFDNSVILPSFQSFYCSQENTEFTISKTWRITA